MAVQLNHTIVMSRDKRASADFVSQILGLPGPVPFGPFLIVQTDNGVSLDFVEVKGPILPQHYAFLIGEEEFDAVFGRIRERGLQYWADPFHHEPGQINRRDGGRGVYFDDPSGHNLEILTRPYGSGAAH